MYAKVKENENLIRDMKNNSILNTDLTALKKHEMIMRQKENSKKFIDELLDMKKNISELNQLRTDVSEMKDLLKELINREK